MAAKVNQDGKGKPTVESGPGENMARHLFPWDSVYFYGKWEAWPTAAGFKLSFNPGKKILQRGTNIKGKKKP